MLRWMLTVMAGWALLACSGGHSVDGTRDEGALGAPAADDGAAGDGASDEAAPDHDARGEEQSANDGEPAAVDYGPLTYHADIKPILDAKCATCHRDGGIGPMPLTSYDEVEPYVTLIGADVRNDVMPPWTADAPLDFFEGDRRLTAEQKGKLLAWVEQGGPEGDAGDAEPVELETPRRGLERVDLTLEIPEGYRPRIEPDDYRCFVIDWPLEQTRYITGLSIEPDQTQIVHHAIVYHVQPEDAEAVRARDAAEEGPGYTCFGGSGGSAAWLQSYEPGGYGQEIPGELGFEVRPGSVMILQIHYNTLNGSAVDQSWVDFTLEDEVEQVGEVALFAQPGWFAGLMPIAAGDPNAVHSYQGRPTGLSAAQRYEIYWVDLHMHALGSEGGIGIVRAATGEIEPLLVIPEWDFAWQETYILREPVILEPGDQMYLECHWDNTAENQLVVGGERLPPRDVNWGDGTTDEMCLGNVLAAPLP